MSIVDWIAEFDCRLSNGVSQLAAGLVNRQSPIHSIASPQSPIANCSAYSQRPLHVFALRILREVAIEGELAAPVGAELEGDGLARARALDDAVVVEGEGMRHVGRGEGDLHQVVAIDGDVGRREG